MKTKIPKYDLFGAKKVQNDPMRGQNMTLILIYMCDITVCDENLAKIMVWAYDQSSNKFGKSPKQLSKSLKCKS